MHRIDAAGYAAGNLFTDGNPSTGTPATVVDAAWLNDIQENLAKLIEAAGIVLSKGDYTQLLNSIVKKGMQGSYFNIGTAGGTADAITSSYSPAITELTNGMTLYVRAAAANTTTTPTFTPNNGTIAAKTIVKGAGAALAAGDISGGGHWIELQYDATLDKWALFNPATGVTAQAFASNAEAQALSVSNKAISPATLAAALQGANQSLAASGYQKLPGGLIIQWGVVNVTVPAGNGGASATVTFPVSFPNSHLTGFATQNQGAVIGGAYVPYVQKLSLTQCVVWLDDVSTSSAGTYAVFWMAIGY